MNDKQTVVNKDIVVDKIKKNFKSKEEKEKSEKRKEIFRQYLKDMKVLDSYM